MKGGEGVGGEEGQVTREDMALMVQIFPCGVWEKPKPKPKLNLS